MIRVRSEMEKQIGYIAKGEIDFDGVVKHSLKIFLQKFQFFVDHVCTSPSFLLLFLYSFFKIANMNELFEASFSPIEKMQGSKLSTRCGKCKRYMRYINMKYIFFFLFVFYLFYCQALSYVLPNMRRNVFSPAKRQYKGKYFVFFPIALLTISILSNTKHYNARWTVSNCCCFPWAVEINRIFYSFLNLILSKFYLPFFLRFPLCPYCYNNPTLEGMKKGTWKK